ncbi:DUF2690 domain-containing protein [Streptomyces sp. HMX87]|uniref:XRE family transcriptional regulator n=1 Tax=Streptomyces sp. HMX87 TaxID=3390849 RepID=UPI003A8B4929
MPRWKALPDELDPQIKEFASQLRRLVDRSELNIAALADATGYSKTSWERYLNGRLLAPKGAIVALAEVTGTNPVHLTTMWELAERAWSRSEMRHDMTMEAIRISQARAALGELGTPSGEAKHSRNAKGGRAGGRRGGGHATATPGIAGPAGVSPTLPPGVPAQPTAADSSDSSDRSDSAHAPRGGRGAARRGHSPGAGSATPPGMSSGAAPGAASDESEANSWRLAGYRGPSPVGGRAADTPLARPGGPGGPVYGARGPGAGAVHGAGPVGVPAAAGPYGEPPRSRGRARGRSAGDGGKRLTTFVAGVVGVLVVIVGAFFLLNGGDGEKNDAAKPSPSPTASTDPDLPPGVKCSGDGCTGKDAEVMGCGGDLVTTARTATVGTAVVEVRYSKTCGAAWGRVTQAGQGDEVRVSVGRAEETGTITAAGDTVAYTPMVAVKSAADATACVTLASGQNGCTAK